MKLYVRIEAPFEWVRVSGQNVEAFGEVPGLADYPISDEEELVGVVPGEWVTAHRISLPAKSKRQFQAAVPYALEESKIIEKAPLQKHDEILDMVVTESRVIGGER